MFKILYGFVLGVIVGALGFWYFVHGPGQGKLEKAMDDAAVEASKFKHSIQQGLTNLSAADVRDELSRTGTIVREKARQVGNAVATTAGNASITASIKARLVADLGKAALDINVDTHDGLVTLSGTAASHDVIARAVKTALDTDGVHKVVSTIQLKSAK